MRSIDVQRSQDCFKYGSLQTHIVCTTPKFRRTNLEEDAEVYLVVSSGPGKTSEQYGHPMYYYMPGAGKSWRSCVTRPFSINFFLEGTPARWTLKTCSTKPFIKKKKKNSQFIRQLNNIIFNSIIFNNNVLEFVVLDFLDVRRSLNID